MLRQLYLLRRGILLICPILLVVACAGGPTRPQRKKMPELNSLNSQWDDLYQPQAFFSLPVRTGYVDLLRDGSAATFFAVKFPDNSFDSLALSLANSYKPLAQAILAQWAQQQGTGILIDLRQTGEPASQRSEYTLENAGQSIPVIFLYDRTSANRANTFITLLQSVPGIRCKQTGASHSEKDGSRLDCFTGY